MCCGRDLGPPFFFKHRIRGKRSRPSHRDYTGTFYWTTSHHSMELNAYLLMAETLLSFSAMILKGDTSNMKVVTTNSFFFWRDIAECISGTLSTTTVAPANSNILPKQKRSKNIYQYLQNSWHDSHQNWMDKKHYTLREMYFGLDVLTMSIPHFS